MTWFPFLFSVTNLRIAALVTHLLTDPLIDYMTELLPPTAGEELETRRELAVAIRSVTADGQEQRQLARIARFESHFRRDVATCTLLGREGEKTAWQILARGSAEDRSLCVSFAGDAAIALARVRESTTACRHLPPEERLAIYARGSCSSKAGRRLSRIRYAQ